MKEVIAFLVGAAVGAAAALLLAPKSGEELRMQLRDEARTDRERLRREYAQAVDEVQGRLDKVHADVQATLEHVQKQAEATSEAE
jgi:gas vesicle protein